MKKTKRQRTYRWFVEPLDTFTNSIIAGILDETDALVGKTCGDGIPRDLWRCKYAFVQKLELSLSQGARYHYKIFCQEGAGPIRELPWYTSGKSSSRQSVVAA